MSAGRCRDEARALLDFYVNGSLEREEAAAVQAHLESCPACSREVETLLEIAAAIERHGTASSASTSPSAARGPGRWRGRAVAAALLVPTLAGLLWLIARPAGERPRPGRVPAAAIILDLGSGPTRSGDTPATTFEAMRGAGPVAFVLAVPVRVGSRYSAEVRDPEGRALATAAPVAPPDAYGRIRFEIPAGRIDGPGEHEVVVHRVDPAGEERSYRYPFRVAPPTPAEGP